MRAYARKYGEDEEKWASSACSTTLTTRSIPPSTSTPRRAQPSCASAASSEDVIRAVLSHADHLSLSRDSLMEKTLYAVDELSGFVIAVALVQPSKSILDVEASSVRKKMKDKAFARAVNRDDIVKGAEALGVDLDEHIGEVIEALKGAADELGPAGHALGAKATLLRRRTLPGGPSSARWRSLG